MKQFFQIRSGKGPALVMLFAFLLVLGVLVPDKARAQCYCAAQISTRADETIEFIATEQDATRDWISEEFTRHREWLVEVFFLEYLLPALAMSAEQLTAVAMKQMMIVGAFIDAKNQLETQRLFQDLAARAHKDYYPSEGLCTLGSGMRSLAATERLADVTTVLIGQRSLDRQLLNANAISADGARTDRASRAAQFRSTYCNVHDNNRGLTSVCDGAIPQMRRNKDVDFVRTVFNPSTLNINFSDTNDTEDEEDILALMANLYAHNVFERAIPASQLRIPGKNAMANRILLMDMRSIAAKRSVAEQPFHALVGMKTVGTSDVSEEYMRQILQEVGIPEDQATAIVGENPSYYAQMEILTKRVFQRPEFFVDLYDKPANTARKAVALRAISLMQKRDIFKSALRSEAIMSLLLELELMESQLKVQEKLEKMVYAPE